MMADTITKRRKSQREKVTQIKMRDFSAVMSDNSHWRVATRSRKGNELCRDLIMRDPKQVYCLQNNKKILQLITAVSIDREERCLRSGVTFLTFFRSI